MLASLLRVRHELLLGLVEPLHPDTDLDQDIMDVVKGVTPRRERADEPQLIKSDPCGVPVPTPLLCPSEIDRLNGQLDGQNRRQKAKPTQAEAPCNLERLTHCDPLHGPSRYVVVSVTPAVSWSVPFSIV